MPLLTWLEASALATWLRESPTIWAYPTVLTLHTLGMGVLAGACWTLDIRVLGVGRRIPLGPLRGLFPVMWTGFALNTVTGCLLFTANATERATSIPFLIKLLFVALGVVTIVLMKREVYGSGEQPAAVHGRAKALAVLSLIFWLAAITAGRLLAYLTS